MPQFVTTNLGMLSQFNNKDKEKSTLTRIGLFTIVEDATNMNHLMRFDISKLGEDGKFSDTFAVNLQVDRAAFALKMEELLDRLRRMGKGEVLPPNKIIIHNNKNGNPKEASVLVTFDAYTDKERGGIVCYMKIEKKDDGKEDKRVVYFGKARAVYKWVDKDSESDVTDLKVYAFLYGLREAVLGLVAGTSLTMDLHYKRCLKSLESGDRDGDNNSKGNKSNKSKGYTLDDEELPY